MTCKIHVFPPPYFVLFVSSSILFFIHETIQYIGNCTLAFILIYYILVLFSYMYVYVCKYIFLNNHLVFHQLI